MQNNCRNPLLSIYSDTKIILVCFAVNNVDSLTNARDLWIPEIRQFCPNAEILLVGMKVNLRHNLMVENREVQSYILLATEVGIKTKRGFYGLNTYSSVQSDSTEHIIT